ncbi:Carbonic anhydrase XIII [Fasciola hepatica]|uniref:Carbonic anhydrase XIII n=1 Tax=Fasciola hepatica TaxID=6192 RepID=A0A4E0RM50_FASHE|nr:Carbonic anhydrase XIII [Fasciola hepatica]
MFLSRSDTSAEYVMTLVAIICDSVYAVWHEASWNADWDTWWHYKDGAIGGPSYWGHAAQIAYADDVWRSCHMGKLQSPISILSSDLMHDRSLQPLSVYGKEKQASVKLVDLEIRNTGQDIKVEFLDSSPPIILSGGPLSYEYRVFGALIKFGSDSARGSDHQIDGFSFPAELQIYAFNFVLYPNISTAVASPNGLAGLSIFMKIGDHPSADLSALLATVVDVQLKGQFRRLNGLMMSALLPSTDQFITYQGSIPFPACYETVTWIVLNHAVIITEAQLESLRELRIGPVKESGTMANNFRPTQKLNGRSVRTNIDFDPKNSHCSVEPRISYFASLPKSGVY